jgi:hypothetical protein
MGKLILMDLSGHVVSGWRIIRVVKRIWRAKRRNNTLYEAECLHCGEHFYCWESNLLRITRVRNGCRLCSQKKRREAEREVTNGAETLRELQ